MKNTNLIRLPKGTTDTVRIQLSSGHTIKQYLTMKTLQLAVMQDVLPKSYLTRVVNGNISYPTAKKKALAIESTSGFSFLAKLVGDNEYVVACVRKVGA